MPCVWTVSNATIDSGQASRSVWYHYKSVTSPTPTTLTWQAFSNGCYGIVRSSNTLIYPPITAIHLDTFNTISSCNPSDKPMIFTLDGRVGPTNKFTIQLSDTNGSFLHTTECQRFSSGTWNYIQYTLYSLKIKD